MIRQNLVAALLATGTILAQSPPLERAQPSLKPLFNKIWRIDSPTPYPHSSSIYIFLSNGTLLETSCVETYRVATWQPSEKIPGQLTVTEDDRPAFTAMITSATATTLHLHQTMLLGNKSARDLTLTAIDKEFTCPDIPK